MKRLPAGRLPGSRIPTARGELALIDEIRQASEARSPGRVRLGIGDDCAILRSPKGHEILVTTDLCLENRHFRRDWHSPESVGHRCLARGLSDLAAMGGKPLAAFLSLALPPGTSRKWVEGFFRGLRALADDAGVPLAGGDTASSPSPHIFVDIVLVGSVPAGKALRRSGARAGDLVYVTGRLGGSAAELLAMQSASVKRKNAVAGGQHPQSFPVPRLGVGSILLKRDLATVCIDVSDGLSSDLKHLCEESKLTAEIELDRVPIHALAAGRLDLALHGGEDYELLFAVRPSTKMPRTIAGVKVTRIGRFIQREPQVMWAIDQQGQQKNLEAGGWEHLAD